MYFCLEQEFLPVIERTIYSGDIEHVTTKEKSKFPQEFFPEVTSVFLKFKESAVENFFVSYISNYRIAVYLYFKC